MELIIPVFTSYHPVFRNYGNIRDMEIERKFLVKNMPDISGIQPVYYERYFLKIEDGYQERIQRKGDRYEFETKKLVPSIGNVSHHEKTRDQITEKEFERLKEGKENLGIMRDGYFLSKNPDISIKIYRGKYEGLVRAEVEFDSEKEARDYQPEPWMGEEITNSPLGMDSRLLHLTTDEFRDLLGF